MSNAKKIALGLVAILAVVAGLEGLKQYSEGRPDLKGRCFMFKDGSGLAVADVMKVKNAEGKEDTAYLSVVIQGPMQVPVSTDIRKTNKLIRDTLKSGEAEEVNCETGEALEK